MCLCFYKRRKKLRRATKQENWFDGGEIGRRRHFFRMLRSKAFNGWLCALIGGSVIVTVLLTIRILESLAIPTPKPGRSYQ